MKTRRIEVIKSIIEDKTPNQVNFGFGRRGGSFWLHLLFSEAQ